MYSGPHMEKEGVDALLENPSDEDNTDEGLSDSCQCSHCHLCFRNSVIASQKNKVGFKPYPINV